MRKNSILQPQKMFAPVAVFSLAAFLWTATAFAEDWSFYTYLPAPNAAHKRVASMLEQIEKETGGKLAIRVHMGGSLQIKTTNITAAVADNVVQMGDDSFFMGAVPMGGVLKLPLLVRSYEEFAKASEVLEPYLRTAFQKKGVVLLGKYHYPPAVLWSTKKLTSVADLKGQKLRLTATEQGEFLKLFGATGITMGTAEVAPALERGVIDGAVTASAGGGVLWKDLLKYNLRFGMTYSDSVLIANSQAFEKLPKEMQARVRKIVADAGPGMTQAMREDEESLTKQFARDGMTVSYPTPEEVADAARRMAPFWDSWAVSRAPEIKEALAKVRQVLKR